MDDADFMRAAIALARQGLGETAPNPTVGCVIVRDGRVVGRGRTAPGGRPHAETAALVMAGAATFGATAYITLEPCAHQGKTPPCAEALVAAGITRVVVAARDPDPRVNGRGISLLRDSGIQVVEGVGAAVAEAINEGFFSVIRHGRPMVTLATPSTCPETRCPPSSSPIRNARSKLIVSPIDQLPSVVLPRVSTETSTENELASCSTTVRQQPEQLIEAPITIEFISAQKAVPAAASIT